ncbi:MAG TPA: glycosyltransferase family 39 protein, partial [Acidobacteriota bacterium]|nr:glycosyltransferase family 39 protein [Acidobacteriota bacterium]
MSKKKITLLTLILFLVLFSIRFIHLSADPPYDLSMSGGPYGDPGGYSFNARNKILFGKWEIDNYNPMYISIVPHYFTYFIFKLFGVGYAQKNLVPVMFSCLSIFFFFLLLRKRFSSFYALLGSSLLGMNYLFLMFSRVANRVMPPLLFLLIGLYFLQKGKNKATWLFGAGCSFFLALISKSVVFYILGAIGLGYLFFLVFGYSLQQIAKRIAYLGIGFFLPSLLWFIFIYLPHKDSISIFMQLNRTLILPPSNFIAIL